MSKFQGWILSLSDGRQLLEGPPQEGEPSSWQQVINFLNDSGLKATALTLVWNGVKISAMPKAEGYFQAYEARMNLFGTRVQKISRGIGAVIGDQIFIIWINELGEISQEVRPLGEDIVHTTLRD